VQHLLDNPIYHALQTGNQSFAAGNTMALYMNPDIGLFAGLQNNTAADLQTLHDGLPAGRWAILFTPQAIEVSDKWTIKVQRPLLQMVHEQHTSFPTATEQLIDLTEEQVPAMLALTKLTNPGPFFTKTIAFGNYKGIFKNNQLAAMIGQRLQPGNYVEISAVCTHPDYTGKGYAAQLLQVQIDMIQAAGKIPFLHVYPENPACKLYRQTGFTIRKEMVVYLIEKNNSTKHIFVKIKIITMHTDIAAYHNEQTTTDKAICDTLAAAINKELPQAESKIWHRHPVWFINGNPVAGYSKLKTGIRLLFWSGQSFDEPLLQPEGSFKAAAIRYTAVNEIIAEDLKRWLHKAAIIQWDYKNIVKRKGVLERLL